MSGGTKRTCFGLPLSLNEELESAESIATRSPACTDTRAANSWIAFWFAVVVTVGPVPTDWPLNLPPPASVRRTIRKVSLSTAAALIRNLVTTPDIGAAMGKLGLNLFRAIRTRVQGTGIGGFRHCVTLGL